MKDINNGFGLPIDHELQRKGRFVVKFLGDSRIPQWLVQSINIPTIENNKLGNIEIEFINIIGIPINGYILDIINDGKKILKDRNILIKILNKLFPKIHKVKPYLFSIEIIAIDPTGIEIEKWCVDITKIISVDFGSFYYGLNDCCTTRVILEPLNSKLIF